MKRAYANFTEVLGGVWSMRVIRGWPADITACPTPKTRQTGNTADNRVVELRSLMNKYGLTATPIILAGGIWSLKDWEDYIDNPEIGPVGLPVRDPSDDHQRKSGERSWKR